MPNVGYDFVLELAPGEQYKTYTTEAFPVGTVGYQQDGRAYKFAQAGGSTLVVGNVLTAPVPVSTHQNLTAVATAVGARTIACALGNTNNLAVNQYKGGILAVSVTPGGGDAYGLMAHVAAALSTTLVANLADGEAVRTALTTTSRLSLVANPYRGVIQAPISTLTSQPVGICVSAPTTTKFCWVQTRGLANVLTSGTVIIGEQVISPAGAAGAVGPNSSGGAEVESIIGRVVYVAADSAWSTVDLNVI